MLDLELKEFLKSHLAQIFEPNNQKKLFRFSEFSLINQILSQTVPILQRRPLHLGIFSKHCKFL